MEHLPRAVEWRVVPVLGVKMLEDDVKGSARGDPEKVACQGVVVGNNGTPLAPLFLLLEVDDAIRDREGFAGFAGAPLVSCAQGGWDGGLKMIGKIVRCEVEHGLEKFR